MELKISHPATSGPSLSQFFSNLGTTTQLQGLSITCPSSAVWRSIRDEVVSCVTNSRFLRDLRLPTCALSPTLVGELVRSKLRGVSYSRYSKVQRGMPTLAHYRGTLDSNDAELIQPLSETPVSTHALEYLTICGTAESIAGIQHRLDLGALRRIDIALVSVSSSRDVRALTELVAAQCPRLTAFSLAAPALDLAAADLPRVAWDDFRALTCLHELQVFQVEWDSAVRIVQTDVEALARAWPALRAFRVCSLRRLQNDLLGAAGLTLAAYLPFAAHCPHIRALDLELAPTLPDEMPKAIPRMAKIEQLMVTVGLPLPGPDRAAAVATFLRALAPREAIQARPPMYIDMLVRELHEPQRLPREWGAAVAQLVRWKESLVDAVKQR
ncbi:hypothetical protein PsYK624_043130 [Phanerochaete sordida]|uniref:F-box domain-containing protein n=1 Tax=Phanerochaete sordida TaxID=48140 RepID=A0A9P3G634_9APHY|nr:hypothetical protein PsYK624_043130 [Phanerochaete sordida]